MSEADTAKILAELRENVNLEESVVVSTCLRTEVYAVVDRFHDAVADVEALFARKADLGQDSIEQYTSVRFDSEVPRHLFSVAAGLESAVVGEPEVLGQIRRSWDRSRQELACGPVLSTLFRHAVETGKRVRSETAIARGTTSFSNAAVELAIKCSRGSFGGHKVLVLGAGAMGIGIVRALLDLGTETAPREIVVANRSRERADRLVASQLGEGAGGGFVDDAPVLSAIRVTTVGGLYSELSDVDVMFSAVDSDQTVVTSEMLCNDSTKRDRPILVIDLGVPRNVDRTLREVDGVTLLDMDDLRSAVNEAIADREEEALRAREIVEEEVSRYRTRQRERGASPTVALFRARVEQIRIAELERQRKRLWSVSDSDWEMIESVTRAVLAKVLHEPTVQLKEAAGSARGERLLEAVRSLFDL